MFYNTILINEYNQGVLRARTAYEATQAEITAQEHQAVEQAAHARARKLARQRRAQARYRAANGAAVRVLQPHGTNAAYLRHRRDGEDACGPCLDGHAKDKADRQANREKML